MRVVPPLRTRTLAGGAAVAALATLALATGAAAKTPGCSSFSSQAAAQERFAGSGGGPSRNLGKLDGDRDGVACEELPGPYAGFATVGYNLKKGFFYGTASMPSKDSREGEFACLYGNRHFADGPRRLKIYRAGPGADRPVSGEIGAEAQPGSGRLVWKLDKDVVPRGRYYVAFEEQIRLSPYGESECPGFRSREVLLPQPSPARSS